jgi:hypothetical protein
MEYNGSTPSASDPGLPPVSPPTGRMFLRLFGMPALIVGGLVAALILFGWVGRMFTGQGASHSAAEFLRGLDDTNPEVRWKAASDLAQVLPRDERLAADAPFALELAARLDRTRLGSAANEQSYLERLPKLSPEEAARQRKSLEADRKYILYLGACLGKFAIPAGAWSLEELAGQEKGLEPRALGERRFLGLLALANLGENLKRFDKLPPDRQQAVLDQLEAAQKGEHATRARQLAEYLQRRRNGKLGALGVDRVLEKCADAADPLLREMAAFAMNFWTGTASEDAGMEKTLLRLAQDDGRGEDEMNRLLDEKPEEAKGLLARLLGEKPSQTRTLTKRPGFRVQANATIALAHRGSPRTPLGLLAEMLDETLLRERFVILDRNSGKEQPDEELAVGTLINALRAVPELHRKRPEMDLSALRPLIDRLAQDSNKAVQTEAVQAQLALDAPK